MARPTKIARNVRIVRRDMCLKQPKYVSLERQNCQHEFSGEFILNTEYSNDQKEEDTRKQPSFSCLIYELFGINSIDKVRSPERSIPAPGACGAGEKDIEE